MKYKCCLCKTLKNDPYILMGGVDGLKFCPDCDEQLKKQYRERETLGSQNRFGRKDDTGKPRMGLLPLDALVEVAKVLTYGAAKYAPDNWKAVPEGTARYTDALLRHLAAWQSGEVFDTEVKDMLIRHIAEVACNALFLVWFELQKEEKR